MEKKDWKRFFVSTDKFIEIIEGMEFPTGTFDDLIGHKLIKLEFSFLISLNSGRYLPACLIIHIGLKEVSLLTITLFKGFINKYY